jgi:hypothetical protein
MFIVFIKDWARNNFIILYSFEAKKSIRKKKNTFLFQARPRQTDICGLVV